MKRILLLFVVLLTSACAGTSKVKVEEADRLIAKKVQILDVRTEKEWNEGHLEGAIRCDFYGDDFAKQVVKAVDPKKPVLVYCRSGGRSAKAVEQMKDLGFVEIRDLEGGITAWEKAGKKVVK